MSCQPHCVFIIIQFSTHTHFESFYRLPMGGGGGVVKSGHHTLFMFPVRKEGSSEVDRAAHSLTSHTAQ